MTLVSSAAISVFPTLGLDKDKDIPGEIEGVGGGGGGGGREGEATHEESEPQQTSSAAFIEHSKLTLNGDERHTNIWLSGSVKSARQLQGKVIHRKVKTNTQQTGKYLGKKVKKKRRDT